MKMTMSNRPRVFVARVIPDEGLELIRVATEATVWANELPPPRDVLFHLVAGCDGIVALLTDSVDVALLDAAGPQLKVVSNYAVGVDNVDVGECTRRGIAVGNTPGALTETTADLGWALMMAAARRVVEGADFVRAGRWKTWGPLLLLGPDIHGSTLGIVGFGRIGQAMARRAAGFGMSVLYNDVHRVDHATEIALGVTYAPLPDLAARADFVSLHVGLDATTHHLIDADMLRRMKPSAILVNTSRGPIVDGYALAEALRSGVIAACGS